MEIKLISSVCQRAQICEDDGQVVFELKQKPSHSENLTLKWTVKEFDLKVSRLNVPCSNVSFKALLNALRKTITLDKFDPINLENSDKKTDD